MTVQGLAALARNLMFMPGYVGFVRHGGEGSEGWELKEGPHRGLKGAFLATQGRRLASSPQPIQENPEAGLDWGVSAS